MAPKISVDYDAINESNTFSNGDRISGRVTVVTTSRIKIKSLTITAKGGASVSWSEPTGQSTNDYYDEEDYFSITKFLLKEGKSPVGSLEVAQGHHVYPFSIKLPNLDMPPPFRKKLSLAFNVAEIKYSLVARLTRSKYKERKAETNFTYIPKVNLSDPGIMIPQEESEDKHGSFTGNISMKISTDKMAYYQGQVVPVTAEINNRSSQTIVPKFYIYRKLSFFAQGNRLLMLKDILKEKAHKAVGPYKSETMTNRITIPTELPPSLLNCRLIMREYRIKVVLGLPKTRNVVVKLPLIVQQQQCDLPTRMPIGKEVMGAAYNLSTNETEATKLENDQPIHKRDTQHEKKENADKNEKKKKKNSLDEEVFSTNL